jgi:phosphopentomutase
VVPLQELYRWCEIARAQLQEPHRVGRVIARPFTGGSGAYERTQHRRDYAVPTPRPSLLTLLQEAGHEVVGIGKIEDLFGGDGLTQVDHTTHNDAGMEATRRWYAASPPGSLVFTNLNDFDTLWGHRNDAAAYAAGLQRFDAWLGGFLEGLGAGDLLVVTSDHGNDPTTPSTDHSREYLPILARLGGRTGDIALGERQGLMDIAATILEHVGHPQRLGGRSFRSRLEVP